MSSDSVCNYNQIFRSSDFVKHSEYNPNLILLSSLCNCHHLYYNLQSQRGQDQSSKSSGSKAGPNSESVPDPDQEITTTLKTGNKQMKLVSEKSLGLDQAILHSINCCRKWSTLVLQFVSFRKCTLVSFFDKSHFLLYSGICQHKLITLREFSQQESDLYLHTLPLSYRKLEAMRLRVDFLL